MPFVLGDNIQETSTTTGTGQLTLAGPVSGALDFDSQLANNDTTFYAMSDGVDFESGIGTFTNSAGDKLTRDTVLFSTNGGALVNWGAGTRNVFCGLPGASIGSLLDPAASTGIVARTALDTYAGRTLTAGANIAVVDGDGISGDPTVSLGSSTKLHAAEFLQTVSDIANGSAVSILRFIDPTKHAGILAKSNTDDHAAAFTSAIAAAGHITVPYGRYYLGSGLTVTEKDFTLEGQGTPEIYTDHSSTAFTIGQASYLSTPSIGNFFVNFKDLYVVDHSGTTGILFDVKGLRSVRMDTIHTLGGTTSFKSEQSWAGSVLHRCRFQNASSHCVHLLDQNNFFRVESTAALGATGTGFYLDAGSSNLKGITFDTFDAEGCGGGIYIVGNCGALTFTGGFLEGNSNYNMRVDNTSQNIYGLQLINNYIYGSSGVDVEIGTSTSGTQILGFTCFGNEFVDGDLVVIGNAKVDGFIGPNTFGGTASYTVPQAQTGSAAIRRCEHLALRYETAPQEAWGSAAGGHQGDVRYANGRLSALTASGWEFAQIAKINALTGGSPTVERLPTGITPSVTSLKVCGTNNTGSTTISSFTNGYPSQELIIVGMDGGNTIVNHGGNIHLTGGIPVTLSDFQAMHLVSTTGTVWVEI